MMLESKLALNCLPCSFQIYLGSIVKDAFCVSLMPYSVHNTDMAFQKSLLTGSGLQAMSSPRGIA